MGARGGEGGRGTETEARRGRVGDVRREGEGGVVLLSVCLCQVGAPNLGGAQGGQAWWRAFIGTEHRTPNTTAPFFYYFWYFFLLRFTLTIFCCTFGIERHHLLQCELYEFHLCASTCFYENLNKSSMLVGSLFVWKVFIKRIKMRREKER